MLVIRLGAQERQHSCTSRRSPSLFTSESPRTSRPTRLAHRGSTTGDHSPPPVRASHAQVATE
ncbi:hypothetical protein L227DRAFT_571645 [Lentinus tigrinus ALCF2SS1-6]|uniref:Uncharacterized protein n=1 Tax=Lentinus tigrinus ALCF2SS1-6 TaxID=1328759 RepID=A0A5C2SLP9_9APHY|nr:hypothetical protein L227DRAFT_571645 [Lentinus tigrinus ALCF2SS1-6]